MTLINGSTWDLVPVKPPLLTDQTRVHMQGAPTLERTPTSSRRTKSFLAPAPHGVGCPYKPLLSNSPNSPTPLAGRPSLFSSASSSSSSSSSHTTLVASREVLYGRPALVLVRYDQRPQGSRHLPPALGEVICGPIAGGAPRVVADRCRPLGGDEERPHRLHQPQRTRDEGFPPRGALGPPGRHLSNRHALCLAEPAQIAPGRGVPATMEHRRKSRRQVAPPRTCTTQSCTMRYV